MLAIVIPYYKIEFFEATLNSLALQTNKQFHVYIGDDASPNTPIFLLEKYQNLFSFTYHRFDSNLGGISLVKQWNRCLKMVKNETWVQILGDDDVLSPNVIASFYENITEITKLNSFVIRFATQVIDENGKAISGIYQHPKLELATDFLLRKLKGGTRSSLSEYIFKKEKLEEFQFKDFPLAWSTDTLAVIEFSDNQEIFTINSSLVYFRKSYLNISNQSDSVEKNTAWFKFYHYLLCNYGKKYPKELVNLLFERIEKVQLNYKKTPYRWLQLFYLYLTLASFHRIFILYKRFINL